MSIKMVRQPSDTPNINNIDDIIPMRYAYGGQNGYVAGKGTEISNTVNGTNFTINSGRLVLQGVECDIDATGVTIAVDNIATKRYYTVYLKVNLATNTATIESTYDTADYPAIDNGDDLTENSSGIANMVLYRFNAISGIISEVNKVVEKIKYIRVEKDINGVASIGGVVIPQKKIIYQSDKILDSSSNTFSIDLNGIKEGDVIEIGYSVYKQHSDNRATYYKKIKVEENINICLDDFDISLKEEFPGDGSVHRRIYLKNIFSFCNLEKVEDSYYKLNVNSKITYNLVYDEYNNKTYAEHERYTTWIKSVNKIIE